MMKRFNGYKAADDFGIPANTPHEDIRDLLNG